MRIKKAEDVKFYLYQSKSKIEMLYSQIYGNRDAQTALTIALPALSATFGRGAEKPDLDDKLNAVLQDLEERQLVGTLEEPKSYFRGRMKMRWGIYDDNHGRPDDEPVLVYFGGFEKDVPLMVGLGGSSRHVVGYQGASGTQSRSSTPVLVEWLLSGLHKDSPPAPGWRDEHDEQGEICEAMAIALSHLKPPTQDLEFLAKTLMTGTTPTACKSWIGFSSARAILGTPIFVAQAHPIPESQPWGLDDEW